MSQKPTNQPTNKPTNPLVIAVFGLMLIAFGFADMIFVNRLLGIALMIAGVYLGITGVNKYKALKAKLQQQKKG
jgi:hypothetical protein